MWCLHPPFPAPLPELGLCTMRYSGAPWQPLLSSTHVAVRIARGGFFAAFRGKLVTPRLLSHGSVAGGQRGQSPTAANTSVTVAAGLRPGAITVISPCAYHSPQHQALGGLFQTASERQRPAPSPPARANRSEDRLIHQPTLSQAWQTLGAILTLRHAWQCCFTGHSPHSGDLGTHTVAPSSIKAWLKSPGRLLSTSTLAMSLEKWQ